MANDSRFPNLAPYQQAVATQMVDRSRINPIEEMIKSYQQGVALQQQPQLQRDAALQRQLAAAVQQAQLEKLKRPEVFEVGNNLLQRDPITGEVKSIFSAPTAPNLGKDFIETPMGMLRRNAAGELENAFPFTQKSPFSQQQVVNIDDPTDVRLVIPDVTGKPPPGYQFSKAMEQPMKPSEVISSQREIRNTYEEMPSKLSLFGKGQVPGSFKLKQRLDAMLKPVNGDFTKLNPQAAEAFVTAMNNLRDPTSATLLTEAQQIAARSGIADRFNAYVQNLRTGDRVPPQVAKDIYDVISQVYEANKEDFLENIAPTVNSLKSINKDLTDIGVPVKFANEVKDRIKTAEAQSQPQSEFTNVVTPGGVIKRIPSALVPEAIKRGAKISQ